MGQSSLRTAPVPVEALATSYESTPTTAARLVPIYFHCRHDPSGVKRFPPFTGLSTASRSSFRDFIKLRPFRLTCSIAGGLRVIVSDEKQRYDPKKECLHSFPPLESTPPRLNTPAYRGAFASDAPRRIGSGAVLQIPPGPLAIGRTEAWHCPNAKSLIPKYRRASSEWMR